MATKNHTKNKLMSLEDYICNHLKWSIRKFALEAKVSYTAVRNIMKGRDVRSSVLMKVALATNKYCTAESIYFDYINPGEKKKKD